MGVAIFEETIDCVKDIRSIRHGTQISQVRRFGCSIAAARRLHSRDARSGGMAFNLPADVCLASMRCPPLKATDIIALRTALNIEGNTFLRDGKRYAATAVVQLIAA
jgi:hypothetical protein